MLLVAQVDHVDARDAVERLGEAVRVRRAQIGGAERGDGERGVGPVPRAPAGGDDDRLEVRRGFAQPDVRGSGETGTLWRA